MHELLLLGQVPRLRHEQVLKILAGLAAMQPQRILERHAVYRPQREPEEPGSHLRRGGTQAINQKQAKQAAAKDLYFTQLVQRLSEDDFVQAEAQTQANGQLQKNSGGVSGAEPSWSFQFHDIPDTGNRGVLVRQTHSTDILAGDPHTYMTNLGNQFVSEYYQEGHRFVHDNVIILLYRVLQEPGVRSLETSPKSTLPAYAALHPLDPSGGYILQAMIRVHDLSNPTILDAGVDELKKFKGEMKGSVELDVPDRLLLDTRVKFRPKQIAQPATRPAQTSVR